MDGPSPGTGTGWADVLAVAWLALGLGLALSAERRWTRLRSALAHDPEPLRPLAWAWLRALVRAATWLAVTVRLVPRR